MLVGIFQLSVDILAETVLKLARLTAHRWQQDLPGNVTYVACNTGKMSRRKALTVKKHPIGGVNTIRCRERTDSLPLGRLDNQTKRL